jgi:hypothetical protein
MKSDETKNEKKQESEVWKTVVLVLFPAIYLSIFFAKRKATKASFWRFVETSKVMVFAGGISFICSLYLFKVIGSQILEMRFEKLVWLICLFYILQVPIVPTIIMFRLKQIASDLSLGKLEVLSLPYIRGALTEFGFDRAKVIAKSFGLNTPVVSPSGKPVVGVNAHTKDYRFRNVKRRFPRKNILEQFVEDDLVLANLNWKSPVHQLVIGETGSGKSRLLSRLALAGLFDGWKVVIVDMKGGADELELYSRLGVLLPERDIRVKRFPEQPFNLFRGTSADIQKKILNILPPLTNTPSDFYIRRMMRGIKSVINEHLNPPSNVEEILERLKNGMKYGNSPEDRHWFASKLQGQAIADVLAADVAQCLYPIMSSSLMRFDVGSSWEDSWDICIFSLDGSSRDEVIVGDTILTDFDLHLKSPSRKADSRNYLFIIDEAGVFNSIGGSKSLTNLISRSRSAGVGLVISSQTLLSLGAIGDEIAEATPIRWIGRLSNPQQMVDLVGTETVLEANYSFEEGEWGSPSGARAQKGYVVDPDLARRLETFYWNMNLAGSHLWVYAPPLNFTKSEDE